MTDVATLVRMQGNLPKEALDDYKTLGDTDFITKWVHCFDELLQAKLMCIKVDKMAGLTTSPFEKL